MTSATTDSMGEVSPADEVLSTSADDQGDKHRPKIMLDPVKKYTEFKIHVISWNIASTEPSQHDIESLFLPQQSMMLTDLYTTADILVVGLQEAYQNVQDTMTTVIPVVGKDPLVEAFSSLLCQKGFTRLSSSRLLGILTMVFVKKPLLCYISEVQTYVTRTGMSGWFGNKGASSVRFKLGDTSVCFTNCHLNNEANERRTEEIRQIFGGQVFSTDSKMKVQLMDHDILVLFGDLNFRLDGAGFDDTVEKLRKHKRKDLLNLDQLLAEQLKGKDSPTSLYQFMEMQIDFSPSYKFEPGTDDYTDGGKGRVPAWCDRILWRTHDRRLPSITDPEPRAILRQEYYGVHMQPRISDHKAVSAGLMFSVDISEYPILVVFHMNEWVAGREGTIGFDVMAGTEVSMWDWVGLYPTTLTSVDRDYVYWIYAPAPRGRTVKETFYERKLAAEQVPSEPGTYMLVYKSVQYNRVIGMSPLFRIVAPPPDNHGNGKRLS